MVSGSRKIALGLSDALRRPFRAIWASCSRVSPNSCIRRRATWASQFPAETAPKGIVHCMNPIIRGGPPPGPVMAPIPGEPRA